MLSSLIRVSVVVAVLTSTVLYLSKQSVVSEVNSLTKARVAQIEKETKF